MSNLLEIYNLSSSNHKIDYLYHISDVHINLQKRHPEFREVFERLYNQLQQFRSQGENGLIVLTGDILNSKNIMTPELIVLVQEFFSQLSQIYPVIMIAGNHDAILTNSDRMDSLTPLVFSKSQPSRKLTTYKSDKYDNFYYLRESGLYKYNNIIFSVASVFDSKVIPAKDIKINNNELRIALHHGTLDGSKTDLGHTLNSSMKISDFENYDAVLLGDIHKYQYLDAKQRIYYAGSLIQLNHGESINYHGFLKWDLKTLKTEFYEVPNDYGFCTITIRNNQIIKQPSKIPTKPRIRYRIDQLTTDQKFAEIRQQFRQKFHVQEEIVDNLSIWGEPLTDENQIEDEKIIDDSSTQSQLAIDILNSDVQKQLIVDYFTEQQIDKQTLDQLLDLNKVLNEETLAECKNNESAVVHNSNGQMKWKIKRLTFSNMFNYGDNNIIDFSQFNQICGIFGENAIGKSSILDIILFVLFDKCSRGDRIDILNLRKTKFDCELIFCIGNNTYRIFRNGAKYTKTIAGKKRTSVRIDVVFEQILSSGHVINLSGQDRNETNKKIREIIGTYDDFLMSTFLLQKGNDKFLKMSQVDQKTRLYDLFKLNWFEKLYTLAKAKMDYYNHRIKDLEKLQIAEQIVKQQIEFDNVNLSLKPLSDEIDETDRSISDINNNIFEMKSKILPLQSIDLSLEEITENISSCKKEKDSLVLLIEQLEISIKNCQSDNLDIADIKNKMGIINDEIRKTEVQIANLSSKMTKVSDFDYKNYPQDKNRFENHIDKESQKLVDLENEHFQLTDQLKKLQSTITKESTLESLNKKKQTLVKSINQINSTIKKLYSSKKYVKNGVFDHQSLKDQLESLDKQKQQHQKAYDEKSQQIEVDQRSLKNLSENQLLQYNDLCAKKIKYSKLVEDLHHQIQSIESSSDKLLKLEYDPQCKYCTNNIFVIEAKECIRKLDDLINERTIMTQNLFELESQIMELNTHEKIRHLEDKIKSSIYEKTICKQQLETVQQDSNEITQEIDNQLYNCQIEDQISQLSNDIKMTEAELVDLQKLIDIKTSNNDKINLLKEKISDSLIEKLNLQKSIETNQRSLDNLNNKYKNYELNQNYIKQIAEHKEKLNDLNMSLIPVDSQMKSILENEKNHLKLGKLYTENKIIDQKLDEHEQKLKIHHKNKEIKLINDEFECLLKNLQLEKGRLSIKLLNLSKKKEQTIINKTVIETKLEQLKSQSIELQQLRNDVNIYQLYCQCLGKNGLPYELLMKIIGRISEISNNILKQIADFTIQFVEDADRKKLSLLLHRQGLTQSTEMTSGFEEFIIELSLKIAFSMVSNVTRPNFLAIDEGFGCLDSDHLSSLIAVLNFIKTKFEFILIITHVNELKGQGDYYIDIKKLPNGDSQVNNYRPTQPMEIRKKITLKLPSKLKLKIV